MMSERKIVRKWIWAWEFEKEDRWLNTMAQSGWVLDRVGFCRYEFVRSEPGEYTVRLEMHEADAAYISFMEECGAEYIGRVLQWVYFRRKNETGAFDIFSDLDSRIEYLNKIGKVLGGAGLANLMIGLANVFNPVLNISWINLTCATLLMYGLGRIHGKKEQLEKERELQE